MNKQQLLIEYTISSVDIFALCKNILQPEYFDPEYRKTVDFIHTYYNKYSSVPSSAAIAAETGMQLQTHTVTTAVKRSSVDEIEAFCKRKAIEQAIRKSPKLINEEKYNEVEKLIRDAISISLNRDMGISYFSDPATRLQRVANSAPRTSTLWPEVDELLNGGLARTEMVLFSANSGGGKSITLANLAVNFLQQGLHVMYISLELSEDLVAGRFDTMFTGIPSFAWRENHHKIADTVTSLGETFGTLNIKRMNSGTNASAIRAYVKEYELLNGYVPDLLIVDYLDIMGSNEHVSADNVFEKDKRAAEQLRDIGMEYNMFIATASQQNRSAIDATELNQSHIAGGISKVNTVDVYISILLNATMKAQGTIGFAFLKTRNSDGVGKTCYLKWDSKHLRVLPKPSDKKPDSDAIINRIQALHKRGPQQSSAFDIDD